MNDMNMHFSLVTILSAVLLCQVSCQTIRYLKFAANARVSDIYADGKPLGDNIIINKPWSQPTILPLPWNSSLLALRLESSLIPKAWIMSDSTTKCVYVTRPAIAKCVTSSDVAWVSQSWFRTDFNDFRWPTAMVSRSAQSVLVYPATSPQFCTYAQWLWTPTAANVIYCRLNITQTDACKTGNGGCSMNAQCTNIPGNRTCSCNVGYTGDGFTCNDIDECTNSDRGGCNTNAQCRNTRGSRICSCNAGYTGDGLNCTDIDECKTGNGGCDANATCTNSGGSRTCCCKDGFYGDGSTCTGCPQFCQTCTGPTTCTSCDIGHQLSVQGSGDAFCCQSNCVTCSGPTTCSLCSSGYYIDSSGVCQGCSQFCATCTGPGVCTSCINVNEQPYTNQNGDTFCCIGPQMNGACFSSIPIQNEAEIVDVATCQQNCLHTYLQCTAIAYLITYSACYYFTTYCSVPNPHAYFISFAVDRRCAP